jgi:dihydrofolate reductase
MIVAMAKNRVIGRENQLPWHLPEDLKYFKRVTMGKPIVMGRKTYESIGRPLPGRLNVVLTRDARWQAEGVTPAQTIDGALAVAIAQAESKEKDEVMIIGGDQVYALCLPLVDRLYVTQVHAEVEGDAYFPEVDWSQWHQISSEDHQASDNNPYDYSFVVYDRVC